MNPTLPSWSRWPSTRQKFYFITFLFEIAIISGSIPQKVQIVLQSELDRCLTFLLIFSLLNAFSIRVGQRTLGFWDRLPKFTYLCVNYLTNTCLSITTVTSESGAYNQEMNISSFSEKASLQIQGFIRVRALKIFYESASLGIKEFYQIYVGRVFIQRAFSATYLMFFQTMCLLSRSPSYFCFYCGFLYQFSNIFYSFSLSPSVFRSSGL